MNEADIRITAETTPNPHTLKFIVYRTLVESGSADFRNVEAAEKSPLAQSLFAVANVKAVLIGRDFTTVTKIESAEWPAMVPQLAAVIRRVLANEANPVGEVPASIVSESSAGPDDPLAGQICEVLDREIRPAVAMDGGDIVFRSYRDGIVTLHLQGACSSCPSSILTLKMGVENRLKSLFPEIREVVQV